MAKHSAGAFDPDAFWLAWDRGASAGADVFDPTWDCWAVAREPLEELRRRYAIPALPPSTDATLALLTA